MKRRSFLTAVGTAAAASALPAPAIAQGVRELKLVLSFPKAPQFEQFGNLVTMASGGRLRVKTLYPGELVGSFEVFDAVSEGVADMYWSTDYYWQDRSPAFNFFTNVPYGLTPLEAYAWIQEGGGQELWDELGANFNIKPLIVANSGNQMGGWFAKEMASIESFKGLRYRIPGLGGAVMQRLGAIVVNLPPGEIVPALKSGALDAAEWVAPANDYRVGLHTTAVKFYYYPGFHEPGAVNSLGVNKTLWDSLSSQEQTLIAAAAAASHVQTNAAGYAQHMKVLPDLLEKHGVKLRKFDDEILRAFGKASGEVVAEVGNSDPFTRRVYDSYMKFRRASRRWSGISERAYLNARELDFPYGD